MECPTMLTHLWAKQVSQISEREGSEAPTFFPAAFSMRSRAFRLNLDFVFNGVD